MKRLPLEGVLAQELGHVKNGDTWFGCHYVIPCMIAAGGGAVVNASSMYALTGTPNRDVYTAAKGAISALTSAESDTCRRPGARRMIQTAFCS